ncbi:phage tail tape measure protein [Streptomyces sp. NPDC006172]|uniref:phage tail tape measure protein n=1 Tax=Streptomyces sp. NPDC006172 TaxID=3154470 RepID=UPI0034000D92
MALTVGELNGIITIDDRAMRPALRRAEQAMRQSGQRMGDDAEDAGQTAGRSLGQGLVRGADGQWRDMRGELVDAVTAAAADAEAAARRGGQRISDGVTQGMRGLRTDAARVGQQAGDDLGDGLADGAGDGADDAVDQVGGKLEKLKQVAGGLAMAAGAAAGALLVSSMTDAMEQGKITARLGAQLGATGADARRYGHVAGQLYADAVVEDFQAGADAIRAVASSGLIPPGATNKQIKSIATNAADLADLLEVDVGQAANAAGVMVRNGLAKDGKQAFDLLVKGSRGLGAASEDLLETFTEYGPVFKAAGLSGETAMGLIRQAVQGGWGKDTDKIGDAFKELQLRVTGGAKASSDALKSLGLDADKVMDDMSAGGARSEKAMDQVVDAIRKFGPDSKVAKQAIQNLFGGPGEDLGAALFALDVDKAGKSMGDAAGEADKFGNAMRDNAGTKVEQFKRGLQQGVVDFLGGTVIPAVTTARTRLGEEFGKLWAEAGKGSDDQADRIANFMSLVGRKLVDKAVELTPKILAAMQGVGQKVADYVMANPEKVLKITAIAGALIFAIAKLPLIVAGALSAAAIAMMVGFVSKLGMALNENLPKWWASFKGWVAGKASAAGTALNGWGTAIGNWFSGLWARYVSGPVGRTWNSWLTSVRGLPGRTQIALNQLGARLGASANGAWNSFKSATVRKANETIAYVRGIPGRARAGLGNLGSYLWNSGAALINGFIGGIKSRIGSVRDAASSVLSAARDFFPFSPAKKGPFSGRGYTLYSGQALMRDFGKGIAGQAPAVQRQLGRLTENLSGVVAGDMAVRPAMVGLADTPTPAAWARGAAGGSSAGRAGTSVLRIEFAGPEEMTRLVRGIVKDKGGGDVQLALGQGRR